MAVPALAVGVLRVVNVDVALQALDAARRHGQVCFESLLISRLVARIARRGLMVPVERPTGQSVIEARFPTDRFPPHKIETTTPVLAMADLARLADDVC